MSAWRANVIGRLCAIVTAAVPGCAPSRPPGPTPPGRASVEPAAARADRSIRLFPHIMLDRASGTVEVDARFCLREGILEYIAVAEDGKTYESLLALPVRPSHLQTAVLLAGGRPGDVRPDARGDAPATTAPSAPGTVVRLEIAVGPPAQAIPIERFLLDRRTNQAPAPLRWVFTGSFFHRDSPDAADYFIADVERSVIALWYDATALFNLDRDVGNPYRGPVGLEVHPPMLAPPDTPVRLRIIPVPSPTD